MGRTEMQDAVPMTVGQEFHAFAASLDGEIQVLQEAEKSLIRVNMGATAIGTGHQCSQRLCRKVCRSIWQSLPASQLCPPLTCWPLPGTSRDL